MKILVIIDMQNGFLASLEQSPYFHDIRAKLSTSIISKIDEFKSRSEPIILVEFNGEGPTISDLKNQLNGYPQFQTVAKNRCDGSQQILEWCRIADYQVQEFQIAGINLDACVHLTIEGLLQKSLAKVLLLSACCNGDWESQSNLVRELSSTYPHRVQLC